MSGRSNLFRFVALRTIVACIQSGGHFGSQYYVHAPRHHLSKTVPDVASCCDAPLLSHKSSATVFLMAGAVAWDGLRFGFTLGLFEILLFLTHQPHVEAIMNQPKPVSNSNHLQIGISLPKPTFFKSLYFQGCYIFLDGFPRTFSPNVVVSPSSTQLRGANANRIPTQTSVPSLLTLLLLMEWKKSEYLEKCIL